MEPELTYRNVKNFYQSTTAIIVFLIVFAIAK